MENMGHDATRTCRDPCMPFPADFPDMPRLISVAELPGSERASRFEGRDHDATVSVFLSRHGPGDGPGLHRHPYEETFIVEEGSVTFTVDDETIEAQAGQIVVVPAGAAHRFVNSGDGPMRQVSIHPSDHVVQEWLE
jgi:quercetin dioxygenase-like cupin family protein